MKLNAIFCCVAAYTALSTIPAYAYVPNLSVDKDRYHDVSLPLRLLYGSNPKLTPLNTLKNKISQNPQASTELNLESFVPLKGFQGLGMGLGTYQVTGEAPDVTGSVGVMQYVQYVNSDLAVFDKATGQVAPGFPKPAAAVWNGFGGACESNAFGPMTVKYDQLAARWVLSQEATTAGSYYHCVALSNTEDATGTYSRYAFQLPAAGSHAQLGMWPDAYYLALSLTTNDGSLVCALDRNKMIQGAPASIQCSTYTPAQSSPLIPADLGGKVTPPAGSPGYFFSLYEPRNLLVLKYFVDFVNPANTSIMPILPPVNNFIRSCRATNGISCAIQPNTDTKLNIASGRLTGRVVYRQFRDYGSFVFNHTIEGLSPKYMPAIRWYEMRVYPNTNFNPIVYQSGTIAPDTKNRFMGSIAIDRFTNIAVSYNVTSSLIYPSIEAAFHNYNDQPGLMTIQPLVTGRGSQVGVNDWTDTSSMVIDPIDECTFWTNGEYLKTTGNLNWSTYIVKFKLAACV